MEIQGGDFTLFTGTKGRRGSRPVMSGSAEAPLTVVGTLGAAPSGDTGYLSTTPPILVGVSPGGVGRQHPQPAPPPSTHGHGCSPAEASGLEVASGVGRGASTMPRSPCRLPAPSRAAACHALWGPRPSPKPLAQAGGGQAPRVCKSLGRGSSTPLACQAESAAAMGGNRSAGGDSCGAEIYSHFGHE